MSRKHDLERWLVAIAIFMVVMATLYDINEDRLSGDTLASLAIDLLISGFVLFTLIYIWANRPRATQKRNQHLEQMVRRSRDDVATWKSRASKLLHGLGTEINQQLDDWLLSKTEKEVALLLIKGMSLKDIAKLRGTSEKTVRHQASSLYAKAQLNNRAELSAFFLEDLLLPQTTADHNST